ncbi:hypothetical protein V2W45_1404113 [Cenococcum geophilum]
MSQEQQVSKGFQALEKVSFLCWLLFVTGTIPQVIRVLSLSGVCWTKTRGCMYLVSFGILELLLLVTRPRSSLRARQTMFAVKFDYGIEKAIGRVTLAVQLSFLAWDIRQIWHPDLVVCVERVKWLYVAAGPYGQ